MKALILNNQVVQVAIEDFEVGGDLYWLDCPENCEVGWLVIDGVVTAPIEPELSDEEIINRARIKYSKALQNRIDNVAQSRDYGDGYALASYALSTNPQWSLEAQTFIAWRDSVWAYAYQMLAEANPEAIPTLEEFLAGVPAITW